MDKKTHTRITPLIFLFILFTFILSGCSGGDQTASSAGGEKEKVLRFAYAKSISPALLAKERGTLEQKLKEKGIKLEWIEFQTGPQMFEAIRANSVDIINSGNMPAVYAQANNTPFVYIAGVSGPDYSLIVHKDSPIKTLEDLRGKKIAYPKGSVSEYMLFEVLNKAGLKKEEVDEKALLPSDAMTAFQGGTIDAWIIWEPYVTMAEELLDAKVLQTSDGLMPSLGFYHARREYAESNKEIMDIVLQDLKENGEWMTANPKEAAKILAEQTGMDADIFEKIIRKANHYIVPLDQKIIEEQQKFADGMLQKGFIAQPVKMEEFLLPQ